MNYNVEALSVFEKQAKRLSKKIPSLKNDLGILIEMPEVNPTTGIALGNNFF